MANFASDKIAGDYCDEPGYQQPDRSELRSCRFPDHTRILERLRLHTIGIEGKERSFARNKLCPSLLLELGELLPFLL
jgi:hypothetical protein